MKKRILSAAALIWIPIIWMLFYLAGKPPAVSLPEYDEVREVQLDTFRMDAARFDGEALCVLLENMRSVRPVSRLRAWQTDRPDGRFVIAFTDEQGTRTAWSFFRDGETCYMEAEDGSLYEGADFMREYVAEEPGWHPSPRGVSAGMYVPDDGEAACASETGCDVRFWLYSETLRQMANGLAGEEAVLAAKETVLREYRLFRYATEQGYGIPETEYDQVVAERIADESGGDRTAAGCGCAGV